MTRLIKSLESKGHEFVGMLYIDGIFYFYGLDVKMAGIRPVREYCRDGIDYELLLRAWKKRGTYILFAHEDYKTALNGAIEAAN